MTEEKTEKQNFAAGLFAFLKEYSVVGMAIGVIVAQSSKAVIDSIVNGLFTPLIDLIVPGEKFQDLTFKIGGSAFNIGSIISASLSFIIVMTLLYVIVKRILKREDILNKK